MSVFKTKVKTYASMSENILRGVTIARLVICDGATLPKAAAAIGMSLNHTAALMRRALLIAYQHCTHPNKLEFNPTGSVRDLRTQKSIWEPLLEVVETQTLQNP